MKRKKINQEEIEHEMFWMSSFGEKITGIPHLIVWVGPNIQQNVKKRKNRIMISNIPDSLEDTDIFEIAIPDLQINGKINEEFITPEILEQIKKWATLNLEAIIEYSNLKIFTNDFLDKVKKINP